MADIATYSRRPFISHDGKDQHGIRAEVKVTLGFGHVDGVEPSKAGKAAKVSFRVDNNNFLVSGWVPVDSPIMKKVEEAEKTGEPIHFRTEIRRKNNIDRSIPLSTLLPPKDMAAAKENSNKALVGVKLDDDEEWTYDKMVTSPKEDPTDGVYPASDADVDRYASAAHHRMEASQGGGDSRSFESTPFYVRNRDGSTNAGSIAVSVPLTLFSFVTSWERDHDLTLEEKARFSVTAALLGVANRLQVAIYDDEEKISRPDLSLGSHTRARAVTFEVVRDFYPITAEVAESSESISEWADKVFDKGLLVFRWTVSTAEQYM